MQIIKLHKLLQSNKYSYYRAVCVVAIINKYEME